MLSFDAMGALENLPLGDKPQGRFNPTRLTQFRSLVTSARGDVLVQGRLTSKIDPCFERKHLPGLLVVSET